MKTKQGVLKALESAKGKFVSGAVLSLRLSVSRTAVWKAVGDLKKEGYPILSVTNKGYMLQLHSDILSAVAIQEHIRHPACGARLHVVDSLPSTNQYARALANDGAPDWTVVVANTQTRGCGRRGRVFFSPPDTGVYLSVVLRPDIPYEQSVLFTVAAAVCVCETIEVLTGLEPRIKWVNDILLDGKKVCGILTEAVTGFEDGGVGHLALGVGVNFLPPRSGFPAELCSTAGALFPKAASVSRSQFIGELLSRLYETFLDISSPQLIERYRRRSCVVGREVTVTQGGSPLWGRVLDINARGGLVVETATGRRTVGYGEITSISQ